MVVDAVIWHRVTIVAGEEAVSDGFGRSFRWFAEFFYTDNGFLDSLQPANLQTALHMMMDHLTG